MINDIAIIGAGGLGREVLVLLHQINQINQTWNICGFYDDAVPPSKSINNLPYLGSIQDLSLVKKSLSVVIAVGNCQAKRKIVDRIENKYISYPSIIHPAIQLNPFQFNKIGKGCVITAGCILTTNITLEDFVLLNLSCTIGHDVIIKKFSSLMPGVNLSGNVLLEKEVYIGTNATVLQQKTIGKHSIIGAGAVVTTDLPANITAVGVPAKIIKKHDSR